MELDLNGYTATIISRSINVAAASDYKKKSSEVDNI